MSIQRDPLLAAALAPALRLAGETSPEALDGLEAAQGLAAGFLEIVVAEADAAELRAGQAALESEAAQERAARLIASVQRADEHDRELLTRAAHAVERGETTGDWLDEDPRVDRLAADLGITGHAASAAEFDDFMLEGDATLSLGPALRAVDDGAADRLARVANRLDEHPLDTRATARLLAGFGDSQRLGNPASVGQVVIVGGVQTVLSAGGQAAQIGDDGRLRLEQTKLGGTTRTLGLHRWTGGNPPELLPSIRAAMVQCLAAADRSPEIPSEGFAGWSLLGAALPVSQARPGVRDLLDAASRLKSVRPAMGGPFATALLETAHMLSRVTVCLNRETMLPVGDTPSFVDIGRIRWCRATARAIVWLPIGSADPDQVGGTDRPWATEGLAARADWTHACPAISLDPDWHARIVLGETGKLLAIAPDGSWWDLGGDLLAIVEARRAHLEPWLDAIERAEAGSAQQFQRVTAIPPKTPAISAAEDDKHKGPPSQE